MSSPIQLNLLKIAPVVLSTLRKRGHSDVEIAAMSPEVAFDEFCKSYGVMTLSGTMIKALDTLRGAVRHSEPAANDGEAKIANT